MALAGAVAYYLFSKAASKVYVENIGLKIDQATFPQFNGRVFITVKNKLGIAVPVQGFSGALYYGDYNIADLRLLSNVTLNTTESTVIPINFQVFYASMVENIANIISGGNYLLPFQVKGELMVENIVIPIKQRIQII